MKRYVVPVAEKYLIFTRRGIAIDDYPAIKNYLAQFREQLEPRLKDWDRLKKWAGRKPGPYAWYEIQDSVNYYEKFEEPKIMFPDISLEMNATLSSKNEYGVNTLYVIPTNDLALLGYLNSKLFTWIYGLTSTAIRGGYLRFIRQYIEIMSVPSGLKDHPKLTDLVSQILALKEAGADTSALEGEVDGVVFGLYGLSDSEINLIGGS